MSVIDFAAKKAERIPVWEGTCICHGCRNEWRGVGEIGVVRDLECPSCGLKKGTTKHLFDAPVGDAVLRCRCGCETMVAYRRGGFSRIRCLACGTDQTEVLFG